MAIWRHALSSRSCSSSRSVLRAWRNPACCAIAPRSPRSKRFSRALTAASLTRAARWRWAVAGAVTARAWPTCADRRNRPILRSRRRNRSLAATSAASNATAMRPSIGRLRPTHAPGSPATTAIAPTNRASRGRTPRRGSRLVFVATSSFAAHSRAPSTILWASAISTAAPVMIRTAPSNARRYAKSAATRPVTAVTPISAGRSSGNTARCARTAAIAMPRMAPSTQECSRRERPFSASSATWPNSTRARFTRARGCPGRVALGLRLPARPELHELPSGGAWQQSPFRREADAMRYRWLLLLLVVPGFASALERGFWLAGLAWLERPSEWSARRWGLKEQGGYGVLRLEVASQDPWQEPVRNRIEAEIRDLGLPVAGASLRLGRDGQGEVLFRWERRASAEGRAATPFEASAAMRFGFLLTGRQVRAPLPSASRGCLRALRIRQAEGPPWRGLALAADARHPPGTHGGTGEAAGTEALRRHGRHHRRQRPRGDCAHADR